MPNISYGRKLMWEDEDEHHLGHKDKTNRNLHHVLQDPADSIWPSTQVQWVLPFQQLPQFSALGKETDNCTSIINKTAIQ